MPNLNRFTAPLWDLDTFYVFDDFWEERDDQQWTDVITDTGTALVADASRGILVLTPSDATVVDNDEVYVGSTNEVFLFAAGRPIYGRFRIQFTETTATIYNAFVGFANAFAANLIVDDGGGLRASGSILAIEKRDTEANWRLTTRNGATVTSTLSGTAAGGAAYQTLEIIAADPWSTTEFSVVGKINGDLMKDSSGNVIRHTVLFASATEMSIGLGAKLGAATNNDALSCDYIYGAQLR